MINGPSQPPAGYEAERAAVTPPAAAKTLTVPAYNWVFGCSAVSGSMIAAYYDRNGFPNMYTGPTGGGVMPLTNASWGTWSDGYTTYPNIPLAASHQGVDGRTIRGSIDDYWVKYGSTANDPFVTGGWTQHTWGTAIGDYMKTSQKAYGSTDGSTWFYNYNSSSQLTCAAMETLTDGGRYISTLDGTYGRKLFYQARGYTVTTCYNQPTDNRYAGGFSFAQYKAEINAGRPVMLNLAGHTIVGVGYNDTGNTVYIHDTWNYDTHSMTWGGSYSGMVLLSVSIVNLRTPVTRAFYSSGAQDGWVLESTETSGVGGSINSTGNIYLGDNAAKKQYRGILSFSTWATIPDGATITAVTLRVKLQSIVGGGNPVATFQGFMVDMKNGYFGTTALQTTDFQTLASKTYGPFLTAPVSTWYSINLTSGKAYVNKLATNGGLTQIRLRFKVDDNNNTIANYLSLYSGNTAVVANRPTLIVTYLP
jgi:hypothetical protein